MKKLSITLALLLLVTVVMAACSKAVTPAPAPAATRAPSQQIQVTPAPKPAWEVKWDTVVAEAKKEGQVSVYDIWRPEIRAVLKKGFKDKYGIDVEFSSAGRGAELLAKIQTEQRAGIYSADVFGAGATTLLASMKPVGVLGKVSPTLILPEVTDGKYWIGNNVPIIDKDDTTFPMIGAIIRTIVYNTDMVKDGEITSYMDLLKPQYKGKITLNDPTVTGSGNAVFYHLIYNLWDEQRATDFLKKLITQQEVVIQRDNRIHTESVVRGKYAIGLAPLPDLISEFTDLKAPIKLALVEEDNRVTSAAGCFGVPVKFAHPNAAAVFINWMLSKEGQTMFASTWGNPSLRKDVPTTGMDPLVIPDPNKKYYLQTEEEVKLRGQALTWSRKVIESLN